MNNFFILDGQTDEVLGHINKKYVIDNEHEQDLPTHKDYFRFTVLAENKHSEHLNKRNGLIVPGEDGELLEFRIFESIKYRNNEGLFIEVHALATYLDLKTQKIFDPHKTDSETALQHATIALYGTEWQVGEIGFKGIRTLTFDNPFNSYDYILRISREFELEPRFYIKTDGNKITGRYVDLVERIGEFRGRTIEFGRDLQRIERKEDTSNIVTALWVYGPEKEDGARLKVLVEDDEARQRWGRRGQHIIDYYEPQTENQDITEERLRTLGEMELRKRINAVVTYEAAIVDLENVPGLENKKIRFGDTIRIKDTKFNPPLYLEARVFNQKRDVFNKANKTVQLGDYIEYTEDEVKAIWNQLRQQIRDKISEAQLIEYTYSKEEIDTKDIQIKTSVEEYARTITDESKQEVIVYVDETIEPIEVQINGIAEDVAEAYSQISQAFDEIELKVSTDEVINAINISSESIKISADRIEFEGHIFGQGATFEGDVKGANIIGSSFVTEGIFDGLSNYVEIKDGIIKNFQRADSEDSGEGFTTFIANGGLIAKYTNPSGVLSNDSYYRYNGFEITDHVFGSIELKPHVGLVGSNMIDRFKIDMHSGINIVSLQSAILQLTKDNSDINTTNYLEFRNNVQRFGYIGYGSPANPIMHISNEIGDIRIVSNTRVQGDFSVDGSKSAVVQTENYGERLMYAVESPDNRFIDVIEVTLKPGEHWININPMFAETINGYIVLPIAQNGGQVRVLEKRNTNFKVDITSDFVVKVAFVIYGKRKGYEEVYMAKFHEKGVVK